MRSLEFSDCVAIAGAAGMAFDHLGGAFVFLLGFLFAAAAPLSPKKRKVEDAPSD